MCYFEMPNVKMTFLFEEGLSDLTKINTGDPVKCEHTYTEHLFY